MQHSPYEIKERLLGALDKDYNVVDMASVIQVISLLEKTHITKDALERTRLGKFVNELRKRTSNESLARRAKELVKNWRRLLEPPSENVMVNGERISPPGPGPGAHRSGAALLRHKISLEGHHATPNSRYKVTVLSPNVPNERTASPLCCSASSSPIASMTYAPVVKCEEKSASASPSHRPHAGNGKHQSSPSVSPTNSAKPVSPPARRSGNKSVFHSTVDLAKTNVANKRLRKDDGPNCIPVKRVTTPPVNSVHVNGLDNGERAIKTMEDSHSEKRGNEKNVNASLLPSSRLQKVKTTQQLIDELQNKKGSAVPPGSLSITLPVVNSETRTEPLVTLKKTGRKNAAMEAEMSKTKSELMDRFLKSSASIPEEILLDAPTLSFESVPAKPISQELERIFQLLPPVDPDAIIWEEEEVLPSEVRATPETIQRYCADQWAHVNGSYDHEGNWRSWDGVTSGQTADGQVLRILPYVNTEW